MVRRYGSAACRRGRPSQLVDHRRDSSMPRTARSSASRCGSDATQPADRPSGADRRSNAGIGEALVLRDELTHARHDLRVVQVRVRRRQRPDRKHVCRGSTRPCAWALHSACVISALRHRTPAERSGLHERVAVVVAARPRRVATEKASVSAPATAAPVQIDALRSWRCGRQPRIVAPAGMNRNRVPA